MWTTDEVANLAHVRELAQLPFETSMILFMRADDALTTRNLADQIGERHNVHLPAIAVVEQGCKANRTRQVILVHNHPAGDDPLPSDLDLDATDRYKQHLAAVGIELLDHIIVSRSHHFSFRAAGLL